jgi:hypothetical protein
MTMVIDGSLGLTFPDTSKQYNSYYNFKNRIINGAMVIDQRNAGASVTPGDGQYVIDRWQNYLTQSSKFSVQRNAGAVTPPAGFTNYLGVTSLSAYSVLSSDIFATGQQIEGFNVADFAWGTANAQTVTMSFWVRSSLTGTFGGSLTNNAQNRFYVFSYTVSAANTWEYKTITIAGDTSGTWATDNTAGVRVRWGLGVGSTNSGTAGSWGGSSLWSATGAVSVVGTNGATFYITGAQLEKGTQATSFDYRAYGTELALCQRYYSANPQFSFGAYGTTSNYPETWVSFKTSMRASPTVSVANAGGNNLSSITVRYATTEGFSVYLAPTANGMVTLGGGGSFSNWNASIEL